MVRYRGIRAAAPYGLRNGYNRYSSGSLYEQRKPYSTYYQNSYRKPHYDKGEKRTSYRSKPENRRGNSPELYSPSRYSRSASPADNYKPVPKERSTPFIRSSRPQTNLYHIPPVHIQPDVESMLKRLERKFDAEVLDKVLEKLEQEQKELEKMIKEGNDSLENIETKQERNSPETSEPITNENENQEDKKLDSTETRSKPEDDIEPKAEASPDAAHSETEQPTIEELLDADDAFDWLREQLDEDNLAEAKTTETVTESELFESLETSPESKEAEDIKADSDAIDNASISEGEVEQELPDDSDSLLELLEPLEQDIGEPIEYEVLLEEILPEDLEDEADQEEDEVP